MSDLSLGRKPLGAEAMDLRTGTFAHMGALSGMTRDLDWLATSYQTFSAIQKAIKTAEEDYICLDEIEIGCSEETTAGITKLRLMKSDTINSLSTFKVENKAEQIASR